MNHLKSLGKATSEDPEDRIPVKIITYEEYSQGTINIVTFKSGEPAKLTQEPAIGLGLQSLIDELERIKVEYTPCIRVPNGPYVIAHLNASQIEILAEKLYIEQLDDDSSVLE